MAGKHLSVWVDPKEAVALRRVARRLGFVSPTAPAGEEAGNMSAFFRGLCQAAAEREEALVEALAPVIVRPE